MRRHSPSYYSPPRRGYGGRARSPPRRKYGGGRRGTGQSLLVRNIPLNCRPEDLRIPFERYGCVRDVYLPRDYYSGEPRGFAFVEFVDHCDAADAQYHMNRQRFGGREITVVVASETRKRPDDMRHRARLGGPSHHDGRRSSAYVDVLIILDDLSSNLFMHYFYLVSSLFGYFLDFVYIYSYNLFQMFLSWMLQRVPVPILIQDPVPVLLTISLLQEPGTHLGLTLLQEGKVVTLLPQGDLLIVQGLQEIIQMDVMRTIIADHTLEGVMRTINAGHTLKGVMRTTIAEHSLQCMAALIMVVQRRRRTMMKGGVLI